MLKKILQIILPSAVFRFLLNVQAERIYSKWRRAGSPLPPPHIAKQKVISAFQVTSGYPVLVETGTYLGDMIAAQKKYFQRLITVELSPGLFAKARQRFAGQDKVTVINGDSGKMLPLIVKDLKEPAIFWLDGHYSGSVTALGEKVSPIIEEVRAVIKGHRAKHIILIDDARLFTGNNGYPSMEELKQFLKAEAPGYKMDIADDIIRLTH